MTTPSDVSVVLGTLNRLKHLKICVDSILAQTPRLAQLYITDAGSTDGTIEYLRSIESDKVKPIFIGERLGQAKAYNDVFRVVTSRYVCWLSDDNEVANGGLEIAARMLDRDSRLGMVGLKVRDVQGPFVDAPYIGGVSEFGILNVNQGMLPTHVLREIGYFSEKFRDYGLDPDITARVLLAGYDIAYTKEVGILHHRLWEMDKSSPAYHALKAKQDRSIELYRAKYRPVFGFDPFWLAKRGAWKLWRDHRGARFNIHSTKPFLGQITRDWNNILSSRYISLFDPILSAGSEGHLRQRAPWFPPRTPPEVAESEQPAAAWGGAENAAPASKPT